MSATACAAPTASTACALAALDDATDVRGFGAKTGGPLATGGAFVGYGAVTLGGILRDEAEPLAPRPYDWSATPIGGGQVTIAAKRLSPGALGKVGWTLQYTINGTDWTSTNVSFPVTHSHTVTIATGAQNVQVRWTDGTVNSAASAVKAITVT